MLFNNKVTQSASGMFSKEALDGNTGYKSINKRGATLFKGCRNKNG
jgi:hypothetical protein